MQKVAVVTGARRGIGKGIADLLKENGYTVVYSASSPEMEGEENYFPATSPTPPTGKPWQAM